MDSERWKTAMKVCYNGYALEEGSWTRRQGTRWVAHTKKGLSAKLLSFAFSVDEPFQTELGDTYARFFFGQTPLFTNDQKNVTSISAATPAVVTTITHGWADNDTVMFFFAAGDEQAQHNNAPTLRKRQFTIDVLSTTTFALYDAITGAAIDGSTLNYTGPGGIVKRIFELTTAWTGDEWKAVRKVQKDDEVIYLSPTDIPRRLAFSVSTGLLALTAAVLIDGPYLDPPPTSNTTTLDPSGVSGSVTLVASAVTNINGGQGFLSTDVGRLIRLFWEPAAWSSASSYAVGDLVKYNDQYFVNVVATGATAVTPERNVTSWSFAADAVVWTYGQVTARASTTSVTFNILGPTLPDATARLVWRLGLYGDTLGWPTIGGFHDGRLWLGGVKANRIDGSVANSINGPFDFTPTLADGTVTDANAVSAEANSEDRNTAVWMTTDEEGLLVGTTGGEWRGRASANNDTITPFSFDFRRVSKTKSFDTEPARAPSMLLLVQGSKRKIMEWGYFEGSGYKAAHLSLTGRHLTTSGIEEIQYQHEPVPMVWARREDGGLIGSAYKRDPESGYHAAWWQTVLGGGRITISISAGASLSGRSEALWQISRGEDGAHFVEILSPIFEDDTEGWQAFFVDSGITPEAGVVSGANILFYGFMPLVGKALAVMVNGIDTGDYTVSATGTITVPIGGTGSGYTLANLQTLSDAGVDYGEFAVDLDIGAGTSPPDNTGAIMAHIGAENEVTGVNDNEFLIDANRNRLFVFKEGNAATAGIRRFDQNGAGKETAQNNIEGIFGAGSGAYVRTPCAIDQSGFLYLLPGVITNTQAVSKINPTSLTEVGRFGVASGYLAALTNGTGLLAPGNMCTVRDTAGYDYLVSSSIFGDVAFVNATEMKFAGQSFDVDEAFSTVCEGAASTGVAWGLGIATLPSATALGLYKFEIGPGASGWAPTIPITDWQTAPNTAITKTKVGTIGVTEIDAAWTTFQNVSGLAFDRTDGHLIAMIKGTTGAVEKVYLVKINVTTANITWATEINAFDAYSPKNFNKHYIDDNTFAHLSNTTGGGNRILYLFNTSTGVATTQNWSAVALSTVNGGQQSNSIQGSVTYLGIYVDGSYTLPSAEIGDYFDNANPDGVTNQFLRIFPRSGQASGTAVLRVYNRIPMVIGLPYESRGQILRPDYGSDAGATNGPAFGKTRRIHQYAASVLRARGIEFGIDFNTSMKPADGLANADGSALAPGELFTGTIGGTMDADYDTENKIAWRITRPYPAIVTAVAGYLAAQDK
jgi:hypothetical protein